MSAASQRDLVDCVAERLPLEARAEYYRVLRHCRVLPENDEMLLLLNAMQLLTILIYDAPARLGKEREAIEQRFASCTSALSAVEQRLDDLPKSLATNIGPEKIADHINESLRQQFQSTTIPQSSAALVACARQFEQIASKFSAAADDIVSKHRGAARASSDAVNTITASIQSATRVTQSAVAELTGISAWLTWTNVTVGALFFFVAGFVTAHWFQQ